MQSYSSTATLQISITAKLQSVVKLTDNGYSNQHCREVEIPCQNLLCQTRFYRLSQCIRILQLLYSLFTHTCRLYKNIVAHSGSKNHLIEANVQILKEQLKLCGKANSYSLMLWPGALAQQERTILRALAPPIRTPEHPSQL